LVKFNNHLNIRIMKNNKILYLLLVSFMLIFSACDPIVDEENLSDSTNVDGVQLVATQTPPGGNKVTLKMATPGITGYWDYNLGKALTDEYTVVYPIPGKNTFTYIGTLGSKFFTKTVDVQIDRLDTPLEQDWYDLVSKNTAAGKTWVFNTTNPVELSGGPAWWYMSPPDNLTDGYMTAWWNAGGTCCPPSDTDGKITFDLNGAANYNYYATKTGTPKKGSFILDVANKKLTIKGAPILGSDRANPAGVYHVAVLTETELILYSARTPDGNGFTGWSWRFKPL
jgi:hypothetical protein